MITKKAKYAIKAMIYLSRKKKGEHALIGEISESEKIPKKFLEAILLDLRKSGFLGSKKGKGGGYYLIKEAEEINLADVVRLLKEPLPLFPAWRKNTTNPARNALMKKPAPFARFSGLFANKLWLP